MDRGGSFRGADASSRSTAGRGRPVGFVARPTVRAGRSTTRSTRRSSSGPASARASRVRHPSTRHRPGCLGCETGLRAPSGRRQELVRAPRGRHGVGIRIAGIHSSRRPSTALACRVTGRIGRGDRPGRRGQGTGSDRPGARANPLPVGVSGSSQASPGLFRSVWRRGDARRDDQPFHGRCGAPVYLLSGRMMRLLACCSITWAHQPDTRDATKMGVYCGTGMPITK
jgi:hypothetical protein